MLERRHLGTNPLTGAVETFYFDHATDEIHIHQTEDVTRLTETTKALYNDAASNWKGDWHHVASIPMTLLPELQKQGIMNTAGRILDMPKFKAWVNDRDNRVFRTKPGQI